MGIVIDGRLHRGAHGIGAEFGHVKHDANGPLCRCGQRGCIDSYASGWGMLRAANATGVVTDADADNIVALTDRALAGEDAAAELFRTRARCSALASPTSSTY